MYLFPCKKVRTFQIRPKLTLTIPSTASVLSLEVKREPAEISAPFQTFSCALSYLHVETAGWLCLGLDGFSHINCIMHYAPSCR